MTNPNDLQEKIRLLEKKIELQQGLPHLYGWKWYPWAKEFFDSQEKDIYLCAANQISKSSTQIRKAIDWATNRAKWAKLWPHSRPLQFWYLYPTKDVAAIEFEKKWIPEFLPRGKYKDHPDYGWKADFKHKDLVACHFNTDVSIYFKTYAQDASHLQSGTVHSIFCDEELPAELYDELNFRRSATDGHFHMVCTPTLGQEFWREVFEEKGKNERFPHAWKRQVSIYECMKYEDGTDSPWTPDRVQILKNRCRNQAEIDRRIYGKFVVEGNLKYESFDRTRNVRDAHPLPKDWKIYAGVDIGSGGETGHPAAISFVAVNPEHTKGRVFRGWRGDGITTTAGDILAKFRELRGGLVMTGQFYDWQAKDFSTIATRVGEPFTKAEKSHEIGEGILNVLFKNDMLAIYDTDELKPLVNEFAALKNSTPKTKAKDDFIDSLRYAVSSIPWDWTAITDTSAIPAEILSAKEQADREEIRARRGEVQSVEDQEDAFGIDDELASWDELYDVG